MVRESYVISYASMEELFQKINTRTAEWYEQIQAWMNAYTKLVEMENFQGAAADAAKLYMKEAHASLTATIQVAVESFNSTYLTYKAGYYEIEGNYNACMPKTIMKGIEEKLESENSDLNTIADSIKSALNSVNDILSISAPTYYALYSTLNGMQNTIRLKEQKIASYEESQYTIAMETTQGVLDPLEKLLDYYLQNTIDIANYTPQQAWNNEHAQTLYQNLEVTQAYMEQEKENIVAAVQTQVEVYEQMQEDYEKLVQERKDKGEAQKLIGAVTVFVGFLAIVGTAGAATPVVLIAGVTGTCTVAYGVSNMAEGEMECMYAEMGDITSESINPIRDTFFCGNQELYDAWGEFNMTVAGMCIPVGKATMGTTGTTFIKTAIGTGVKEYAEDKAYDKISGWATTYLTNELELNQFDSTVCNLVLGIGTECLGSFAIDSIGKKLNIGGGSTPSVISQHMEISNIDTDVDIAIKSGDIIMPDSYKSMMEGMSPEDAIRYEQRMADLENGTHNNYPGMDETGLALWQKSDVKAAEHIAINKVDTDAVIELRTKELQAEQSFLNGKADSGNVDVDTTSGELAGNYQSWVDNMSSEDAIRYEQRMADLENGTHNNYPGMDETGLALWQKSDVKAAEHIAINKVDTDAVIELRTKELHAEQHFLNGEMDSGSFEGGSKTIDDIIDNLPETTNGKGVARNFESTGGFDQTIKDFDALDPTDVKEIQTQYGPGKVGKLSDGTTVVARPGSTTGGATLEIRVSNSKVYKIRY